MNYTLVHLKESVQKQKLFSFINLFTALRMTVVSLLVFFLFINPILSQEVETTGSQWNANLYEELNNDNFEEFAPFLEKIDFENPDYPQMHAAIFFQTNKERIAKNLPPLKWHIGLETAAYHHSRLMVEKKFFSHTSPVKGRKTPRDRASLAGIKNPFIAENIATNFGIEYIAGKPVYMKGKGNFSYDNKEIIPPRTYLSLARAIVTQWMNSPGHRKNILSDKGLYMGMGAQLFVDKKFNDMVKVMGTQKFQWFREIEWEKGTDTLPPGWDYR